MTTIYKDMEPQPESRIRETAYGLWQFSFVGGGVDTDERNEFRAPYKIGDEIECENCGGDGYILQYRNSITVSKVECETCEAVCLKVKSISPVNQGGVWKWKIEVE